jgi:putative transcriptional regulator
VTRINLAVLLAERKMNVMDLHRATGIRYNTLTDYYHEFALNLKVEHIDKICKVLDCTPGDLLKYTPDKNNLPD